MARAVPGVRARAAALQRARAAAPAAPRRAPGMGRGAQGRPVTRRIRVRQALREAAAGNRTLGLLDLRGNPLAPAALAALHSAAAAALAAAAAGGPARQFLLPPLPSTPAPGGGGERGGGAAAGPGRDAVLAAALGR